MNVHACVNCECGTTQPVVLQMRKPDLYTSSSYRVLLFPPFNNYRRFLVHKVVEDLFSNGGLSTFSIGQELSRRIVVCNKLLLLDRIDVEDSDDNSLPVKKMKEEKPQPEMVVKKEVTRTRTPSVNIYRPPAARFAETKSSITVAEDIKVKDERRSRVRRPDQQVYVPRPKRASLGGINYPVPDPNSHKECRRRLVNDPLYPEKQKRSSEKRLQGEENIDGSYNNSVQEDSTCSEDNSSLSSCETLSTNIHINGIHTDIVTLRSLCNHLDDSNFNSNSEESVVDLEENEVSMLQPNRSHDYENDKFNDCVHLNSSCDNSSSCSSSSTNNGSITRDQENYNFDCNADKVETITSLDNKVQEYEHCKLQKKEQTEIIVIEEDTMSSSDCRQTGELNGEKEMDINCQSVSTGCLQSDSDVSLNVSSTETNDTIAADNDCSSNDKQKNDVESVNKSSHKDRNLKNRRILHSFSPVSDVLIISDPVADKTVTKNEVINKNSVETTANSETKINSKSGNNKVNSSSDKSKIKKVAKSVEVSVTTSSTVSINRDECDWESMFTENGDCLVPGLIEELTRNVGQVKVAAAESDYRSYQTSDERSSDGECIIEIYDFPAEFKTHDLLTVFAAYRNRNFHLKWVDDTHALGIFGSPLVADEVLALDLPFVKTRPLRLAIAESKMKARNLILPPMERPKTCTAMARRLVTGALGLRLPSASKEREAERKVLREARDKRRLEAKQREAIWEGLT